MSTAKQLKQSLIDYMQTLEIIDCHEHLKPERDRVALQVDPLSLLAVYAWVDVTSAGRPLREGEGLWSKNLFLETDVPLEERWEQAWPYIQQIRYGSYYRPTAIAIRDIHGIDDLNDNTYLEVTERMREANKPGIYHSILRDRCRIRTCMVQNGLISGQDPPELFTPVHISLGEYQFPNAEFVRQVHNDEGAEVSDLDNYLAVLGKRLAKSHEDGAKEIKIGSGPHVEPDMESARPAFLRAMAGEPAEQVLQSTVLDFILRKAEELGLPVAVHSGVWYDYRTSDPKYMIDIAQRYPNVRFELYHLGMPFVRDCIFIAKNFPNAYLNLCWCYVVSQEITRRAINEIIDTVPVNKIMGFGGDYIHEIENVYGHLVMARETIAEALAERIDRDRIDMEGAEHICGLWLRDNPARFYGIEV